MLTYAMRPAIRAAAPSGGRGAHDAGGSRAGARSVELRSGGGPSSDAITIARLQTAAGNRAVTGLIAAQREDEKKAAAPTPTPAKTAGPQSDKAAHRKAWANAGLVAGGPLFDLVNSDLSVESLVGMALPELVGLANEGAAAGFAKGTEDSKGEIKEVGLDKKEAGQATQALTGWAQKGAATWLKGSDGQKFLAKAQKAINQHPTAAYWTIVGVLAAAIAGAVTAYFTNVIDPKEIKKTFEVKGLKIDAAVDLGKFQERILQTAKLGLSGKAGPGTLGVEGTAKTVTDKKQSGYELGVTGSYTLGDEKKGPSAKLSGGYAYNTLKDESSASVGANMRLQPVTIDTTFKFQGDGSGVLDTSVVGKLSEDLTVSAGATGAVYGPAERTGPVGYKLALTSTKGKESDKVIVDVDPKARIVTFGTEQTRNLWGGSLTTSVANGAGTAAGIAYARNALKADLKYTLDKAGKAALDIGASGKAEGLDAAVAAKFGLDTGQIEKLTVHLGFTTPDQTLKFLQDLSVDVSAGKVDAKATETIKVRLRQIAVEIEGSLGQKADKATGSARAEVGWKLPSGLILGAGVQATNAGGAGGGVSPWMAGPVLSVGHEALPIRLTGTLFTPIDSRSPAQPVFQLGISGNLEFLSGKKK